MSKFNPEQTKPTIDQTKIDSSSMSDFSAFMGALGRATLAIKEINDERLDKKIKNSENIIDGRELFLKQYPDITMSGIGELTTVRILPNPDDPEAS